MVATALALLNDYALGPLRRHMGRPLSRRREPLPTALNDAGPRLAVLLNESRSRKQAEVTETKERIRTGSAGRIHAPGAVLVLDAFAWRDPSVLKGSLTERGLEVVVAPSDREAIASRPP